MTSFLAKRLASRNPNLYSEEVSSLVAFYNKITAEGNPDGDYTNNANLLNWLELCYGHDLSTDSYTSQLGFREALKVVWP